jgi:uncharacterized repeat protein (TIGR03833 family)
MDGTRRSSIRPGARVAIVLKEDQATGRLTRGVVADILTRSATHPHGIKVRLTSGEVGRVKEILEGQGGGDAAP